jgi:osmotically-inducible protein OsmY
MNTFFLKNQFSRRAVVSACTVLGAVTLASSLTGCFPVVAGGAVMTGLVATDRRTSGAQVEDEGIELRASDRLNSTFGEHLHQNVTSFNRIVLITGEAATPSVQQQAAQLVGKVENVRSVINELVVADKSSLSQRSNDVYISSKVKASLIDTKDLPASAIKVVTERQVVYLMGLVTQREADRATEVARGVDGVKKVVRVFEYVTAEQLKGMTSTATDGSGSK